MVRSRARVRVQRGQDEEGDMQVRVGSGDFSWEAGTVGEGKRRRVGVVIRMLLLMLGLLAGIRNVIAKGLEIGGLLAKVALDPTRMHGGGDDVRVVCVDLRAPDVSLLADSFESASLAVGCSGLGRGEDFARHTDSIGAVFLAFEVRNRFHLVDELDAGF